jgi:hypothetical protein
MSQRESSTRVKRLPSHLGDYLVIKVCSFLYFFHTHSLFLFFYLSHTSLPFTSPLICSPSLYPLLTVRIKEQGNKKQRIISDDSDDSDDSDSDSGQAESLRGESSDTEEETDFFSKHFSDDSEDEDYVPPLDTASDTSGSGNFLFFFVPSLLYFSLIV